jgi:D-beta-D-heptose 7-phosphate kinase/D-beta-D-heptose 1-phosphate adenosyltransferase
MAANVKQNFKNLGIYVDFITNNEVITKSRYIDKRSGQHMLRVDDEPEIVPWGGDILAKDYDAIVISDYDKGFLTYEHIESIIEKSRHGVNFPVFIDTKKTDLARFEGAFVKINSLENSLAKTLASQTIVTLGKQGCEYAGQVYSAPQVEVADVCGAGDTFLAALVYAYLQMDQIPEALVFANRAAAVTVKHMGVYAPTLKEIDEA